MLGIETSCDETAIAIIDVVGSGVAPRVRVLANVIASQAKRHAKFGGVVPHLAKREHQRNLVPVLRLALRQAALPAGIFGVGCVGYKNDRGNNRSGKGENREGEKRGGNTRGAGGGSTIAAILEREPDLFARMVEHILPLRTPAIDAIAVTAGPGLAPALWVGLNFARTLAYLWGKPIIAVNHLEGHIYTNLLPTNWRMAHDQFLVSHFKFPALCLIVSGGHTELVLMEGFGQYRVIGETRDDAAGEAFDKVAKMLGLGFPGGPVLSKLAESGDATAFRFPRPMLSAKNFDFSFSGLKTAVFYTVRDLGRLSDRKRRDVASSFERAVVDVLVAKTIRAARQYRVRSVMIGGGVAANRPLRQALGAALRRELPGVTSILPDPSLTGDNALMIALAGWFNRHKKTAWRTLRADANWRLGCRASGFASSQMEGTAPPCYPASCTPRISPHGDGTSEGLRSAAR